MSPEQIAGTRELDARADLYSLGCLAFELITGHPPYQGATSFAIMAAHVSEQVPSPTSSHGPLPGSVVQAIRRALAKDPAERFASIAEFGAVLAASMSDPRLSVAPAAPEPPTIVVLPLQNLSPDPENAFFADGLTEEIISDLSKVKALRVISRTTAMRYKDTDKDVPTIAKELAVRYVLEGTVRRAGNALRVTAQLIDGPRDVHLWSEKYVGTLDDVFDIQEKIAREIVSALQVTLTPAEARRVKHVIDNPEAYDCYLKARQLTYLAAAPHFETVRQLLERARELVGDHPKILAAMADRLNHMVQTGVDSAQENNDLALALAGRAVALDPDCAEAHMVIGAIYRARGQVAPAVSALRRAVALDPNHAEALAWMVVVLGETGRGAEAREFGARLAVVGPFEPIGLYALGIAAAYDGRIAEGMRLHEEWHAREPHPWNWYLGTMLRIVNGDHEGLATWFRQNAWFHENPFLRQACEVIQRLLEGREHLIADWPVERLQSWQADKELSWLLASLLAANSERQAAVDWIRHAVDLGVINFPFFTRHVKWFQALAGFPPYEALMEEVRVRAAQMEG
jgi:TolB-like protein/tetratricopeptide (TPR) repeat protein